MSKIKEIIDNIDLKIMKENYINSKKLIDEVSKFIIKKKLLIYGGLALNLLLPNKDKFYKKYTINDFDCYSKNAKKDALELANLLLDKGYEYIKVRKALHDNTYKVFVNFIQILDISELPSKTFDILYEISKEESKTYIYKYYKDKYKIVPFILLKSNLHFELARPNNSYYRWEKIYERLFLINKLLKIDDNSNVLIKNNISEKNTKIFKNILKYIKDNELPIIGNLALQYHDIYYNQNNNIEILSKDFKKTKDDILKLFKNSDINILHKNNYNEIINEYYIIYIDNISIKIINIEKECFSIQLKSKYNIGTIDTILYFLYRQYLYEFMINDFNYKDTWNYIMKIEDYLQISNLPIDKRLSDKCYGIPMLLKDILIKKWKKKQTLKYL